jgi:hypothetical protein
LILTRLYGKITVNSYRLANYAHRDNPKKRALAKTGVIALGIGIAAIGIIGGLLFGLHSTNSQPPENYLTAHTNYLFMKPEEGGQYDVGYYDSQGHWVDLGIYSVKSKVLEDAVNVLNRFNQEHMGTRLPQPYNTEFQPLAYVVVVGNTTGVVQVPVDGKTILLDKVNPGYWTLLVTDKQHINDLMYALNTGYKLSAGVMSSSPALISQYPGSIIYETKALQKYDNRFEGGYVIVTKDDKLIPWGYFSSVEGRAWGYKLLFIREASKNRYE